MVASSTSNATSLNDFLSAKMNANLATVFNATFNNEDHMFWRLGLVERGEETSEISALLYFSMDRAFKPYVSLAVTLSIILLVGLLFLVGGSVVLSRGIARPLQKLAQATGRIASGEYIEVEASSSDDEISALTTSFNQMIAAVKDREEKIVFQSCHDAETGLKNRNHFEIILSEEIANNDKFIIMIAEVPQLTEFRGVLDHGHINKLLTAVGQRLEQAAGAPVARVSADAFCLILKDDKNLETLPALVMNSFLIPFDVAGIKIDTGVKLGLTKYPDDSKDPAKLMQYVNSALDLARSSPKGVAWYVADRSEDFKNRLSMMSDLRDGIENGEVTFAYQAKFDLAAGKITTVEALVRWNSSTRGFVPPDDFIPFAERTGDVRHITDWGLREAVSQCAKWRKKGMDLTVAVNLSTSDLMNQNLPAQVLALLTEYALPATSLKLEVTESAVMHDMNRALDVLNMLSAMGMELSIDDYGTGYSSLSYLKKLPVNELKIDKSFVLNLSESEEDRILVRSTVELGHNLGLSITAEGVEDIESVNMLREYGCDVLQGYFISRPLAAADLEKFYNETKFDWA
ncbi:MAG: EAL domain-containing protein [Kordiimonadaceae bacterium]|nr:EAL domain-containing protein [Kordiimonadaceae bacterium]